MKTVIRQTIFPKEEHGWMVCRDRQRNPPADRWLDGWMHSKINISYNNRADNLHSAARYYLIPIHARGVNKYTVIQQVTKIFLNQLLNEYYMRRYID